MRNYDNDLLDLLDEGRIKIAGMIRFDLGEGTYGFIRRAAQYVFAGVTYVPMPEGIMAVSDLAQTTGTAASGFTVQLTESPDDDVTPEVLLNIETLDYRDRPVTIYDLFMHPDTGAVLCDPVAQMRGYVNKVEHIEDENDGFNIPIECESRAIDNSRTNGRVRSHADQQRRADGDKFFEHAGLTGREKINFGKK